jgi:type I restriction enzyme R subunit
MHFSPDKPFNQLPDLPPQVELETSRVRKSVTIDWTLRESARAKIKVLVKRILRKHGYPPDLEEEATKTVLAQAELLCAEWAA